MDSGLRRKRGAAESRGTDAAPGGNTRPGTGWADPAMPRGPLSLKGPPSTSPTNTVSREETAPSTSPTQVTPFLGHSHFSTLASARPRLPPVASRVRRGTEGCRKHWHGRAGGPATTGRAPVVTASPAHGIGPAFGRHLAHGNSESALARLPRPQEKRPNVAPRILVTQCRGAWPPRAEGQVLWPSADP